MPTPDHHPQTFADYLTETIANRRERLRPLWQMTTTERVAAMRRGALTLEQLAAWSARHPEQVPLLNGEFEWIACHTPEAAAASE
jgi:hypothetical protein